MCIINDQMNFTVITIVVCKAMIRRYKILINGVKASKGEARFTYCNPILDPSLKDLAFLLTPRRLMS